MICGNQEFKLQDFADAPLRRYRSRKANTCNLLMSEIHHDIVDSPDSSKNKSKHSRKPVRDSAEDPNHTYSNYIVDIWWLISEHIHPEDTGSFALICKETESIVASPRYWINLYKRYCKSEMKLPEDLRPHILKRLHGLRYKVIRSLFHLYPPLVSSTCKSRNIDFVQSLQCVGIWHKSDGKAWIYCLKFYNGIKIRLPQCKESHQDESTETDRDINVFLAHFSNIFENPDEGCHLLIITVDRFYPIPPFMGYQRLFLSGVRQPLAKELTSFNLHLDFSNYRQQAVGSLVYRSVANVRVVSWWSPNYKQVSNPL